MPLQHLSNKSLYGPGHHPVPEGCQRITKFVTIHTIGRLYIVDLDPLAVYLPEEIDRTLFGVILPRTDGKDSPAKATDWPNSSSAAASPAVSFLRRVTVSPQASKHILHLHFLIRWGLLCGRPLRWYHLISRG